MSAPIGAAAANLASDGNHIRRSGLALLPDTGTTVVAIAPTDRSQSAAIGGARPVGSSPPGTILGQRIAGADAAPSECAGLIYAKLSLH